MARTKVGKISAKAKAAQAAAKRGAERSTETESSEEEVVIPKKKAKPTVPPKKQPPSTETETESDAVSQKVMEKRVATLGPRRGRPRKVAASTTQKPADVGQPQPDTAVAKMTRDIVNIFQKSDAQIAKIDDDMAKKNLKLENAAKRAKIENAAKRAKLAKVEEAEEGADEESQTDEDGDKPILQDAQESNISEVDNQSDNGSIGKSDDDIDSNDKEALDLSRHSTRLRMTEQDTSVYDDPGKKPEDWWKEDPTREPTLCELWSEEPSLYDAKYTGYRTEDRKTMYKRFATVLRVPRKFTVK